jgi:hypothetical protein
VAFGDADASTPAFASVNTNWTTTGATSASFTPPAGSLVRIAVFADTSAAANPGNETVTDSIAGATGWTFQERRAKPDSGSQAGSVALWTKYYAASPGAITVTVVGNATGGASGGFSTKVVAGCTGVEALAEGSSTAAVVSLVVTTVSANVRCEVAATDWNVQANMTAGASQTAILASSVGSGPDTRVYVGVQNAVTVTGGTAVTMSTASPSSGNANNFIGWALVPSAGGATQNATASLTATATVSPTAALDKPVSAAPTFTATVSPTAALTKTPSATLTATATLTPTTALDKPVTASLTATATVSPTAALDKPATASLTATAGITPTASVTKAPAASLTATASLLSAVAVDRPADATLTATATITASASVTSAGVQNATASLTATATITASLSTTAAGGGMPGEAHGPLPVALGAVATHATGIVGSADVVAPVAIGAISMHTYGIAGAVT